MEILDLSLFRAKAQAYGLRKAFDYVVANPDENLDKLLDMVLVAYYGKEIENKQIH